MFFINNAGLKVDDGIPRWSQTHMIHGVKIAKKVDDTSGDRFHMSCLFCVISNVPGRVHARSL
ncbi:hypothetical protein AWB67_07216 [Caballeronia terrestris]|uniref:Uncharacterized protein n=1 Tax=Caballeronia terrestris TaxID=1226301 RepID=A0A158KZH8_9BURK|nr:hypothetical protein AWB67_07216 [Caballeronia terrestris]